MAHPRTCLNCGKDISHRNLQARTCNVTCRSALSRKRDAAVAKGDIPEVRQRSAVQREVQREVRALVKPVVREALTEDVMRALEDLIKLTPQAVATLASQMDASDPEEYDAVLAQKAAQTVMRYTVGHQALVTPEAAVQPQLVVNFDLPRPGEATAIHPDYDADADELFTCDVCHTDLPISERVAGADRCADCHETRKHAVLEQYGLLS